ncbi:choline ABC transporter substrate-binding protein [Pseudomonas sp. MBLB4136]|uniref:choline ABC transporter substrate-binding protein n=1 Tax=Pseudomonas sp. MBLB4136 TaxID=3451558 RepID=UPI003F74E4D6
MNSKFAPILLSTVLCVSANNLMAQESSSCKTMRIADIGWVDNAANNSILELLAEGLGYQPKKTMVSLPITLASIQKKQMDVYLDYWSPSTDETVKPYRDKKTVKISAEPNMRGAKYTLAVPTYLYEKGLKDFADIPRFKEELAGKIHGIEAGSGGNKMLNQIIADNKFGLGDFKLIESSEAAMRTAVARAIKREEAIVFLAWSPHPMNLQFDMTYLSGGDDYFGPNYGAAEVYTITATDYDQRCPNAAKLVANLTYTTDMEAALMARIMEREKPTTVAADWIRSNPQWLDTWLAGVSTIDGKDGLVAVKNHLGL